MQAFTRFYLDLQYYILLDKMLAAKDHHLIRISPKFPENCPSMYSSVLASCK
jgi:hypothetical protein